MSLTSEVETQKEINLNLVDKLFEKLQNEIIDTIKSNDRKKFKQYTIHIYKIVERFYYTERFNLLLDIHNGDPQYLVGSNFTYMNKLIDIVLNSCSDFLMFFLYSYAFVRGIDVSKYNKNSNLYLFTSLIFQNIPDTKNDDHKLNDNLKKCFNTLKNKYDLYDFLNEIEPQVKLQERITEFEKYVINDILNFSEYELTPELEPSIIKEINNELDKSMDSKSYENIINKLSFLSFIWYPIHLKQQDNKKRFNDSAIKIFPDCPLYYYTNIDFYYIIDYIQNPELINNKVKDILYMMMHKSKDHRKLHIATKSRSIAVSCEYKKNYTVVPFSQITKFKEKMLSISSSDKIIDNYFEFKLFK